ncbi:MAG: diguanylate cyclase [Gemmatimonadales bacterium]
MTKNRTSSTYSVLLVEDNPDDALLLTRRLSAALGGDHEFSIRHVETVDAALPILWGQRIDVVLLDLSLPDSFGMGTVEFVTAAAPFVPIVVFTGLVDNDAAIEAIAVGAEEYLTKSSSGEQVARVLRQAIARRGTTDARRDTDAFRCTHDAICRLPNRYLLMDRLAQGLARARQYREGLGLLGIHVSDGIGATDNTHDRLMFEIGRRLAKCTRRSDTLGRIGKQDFGVVLERPKSRAALAPHLRDLISSVQHPVELDGSRFHVRVATSLALYPDDGVSAETLFEAIEPHRERATA